MNWQDESFLLAKRKFRENANIVDVFTNKYGKMSGIVYGGNSRKIRNYLQVSNKVYIIYNSKNNNKLGYFKTELIDPVAPKYFNDKRRTSALLSITSILKILLPESQPNKKIYNSLDKLISNFSNKDWFLLYIFWELNLIKELGYDPNLKNFENQNNLTNDIIDCEVDSIKYQIPVFLINDKIPDEIDDKLIRKALIFNRSIMVNKFFQPNNIILPKSRIILENYFN